VLLDDLRVVQRRLERVRYAESQRDDGLGLAREPVRRRILSLLAVQSWRPSEIALQLGISREEATRQLRRLSALGVVAATSDPDDKRRKHYALVTPDGDEDEPSGLTLFGSNKLAEARTAAWRDEQGRQPPTVTPAGFLGTALNLAVEDRRTANRLTTSVERLTTIVRETDLRQFPAIGLRARRELATTLRQATDWERLRSVLGELEEMGTGRVPHLPVELVLPAYAHFTYERGLLDDPTGPNIAERAKLLLAAAGAFAELQHLAASEPDRYSHDNWRRRYALTLASLADNFCKQTELGWAIDYAAAAVSVFREETDLYGLAHSLLTQGFCHRLRGQFPEAGNVLTEALSVARRHHYHRTTANTLLQLGDVSRCVDQPQAAREYFKEARARAKGLGLRRTQAYALIGLGAIEFRLDPQSSKALKHFKKAETLFSADEIGGALTAMRSAVSLRHLGDRDRAREYARQAAQSYRALRSPAGAAACHVTLCHVTLDDDRRPTLLIETLKQTLNHRTFRSMLELDPWFPTLLRSVAERVEDDKELWEGAMDLITDASARLYEAEDDGLTLLTVDHKAADSPSIAPAFNIFFGEPDEMAGEPRHIAMGVTA